MKTTTRPLLLASLLLTAGASLTPPAVAQPAPLPALKGAEVEPVRLGSPRFREGMGLNVIAWSPDGKALVCGNYQKSFAGLWDPATGKPLRRLEGHGSSVKGVAYSPDGKQIATVCADTKVRLFDAATGQLQFTLVGHKSLLYAVAFSPDGKTLATAGHEGIVRLWDVARGAEGRQLQTAGDLQALAFAPDGKALAAVGRGGLVLWRPDTGEQLPGPKGLNVAASTVAFSPDGALVAVGGGNGQILCWDVKNWKIVYSHEIGGTAAPLLPLAFSADGKSMAYGTGDGRVRVVDVAARQQRLVFDAGHGALGSVAFSPDGKTIATAGAGSIRLWDAATGTDRFPDEGHHGEVTGLAFSPDGKLLASGSLDRTARLWDLATGKELAVLRGHGAKVEALAFSPDGKLLALGGGHNDWKLRLWDVAARRELRTALVPGVRLRNLEFTPDGAAILSGRDYREAVVWDVKTLKPLRTMRPGEHGIGSVALSPDGRTAAMATHDCQVRLWDVATGREARVFKLPPQQQPGLIFSPDGKLLAAAPLDSSTAATFFDVATGNEVRLLKGEASGLLAFSQDGRLLLSSQYDGTVRWWDLPTGREVLRMTPRALAVAISPDGRRVALGQKDCSVLLFDVAATLQGRHAAPLNLTPQELEGLWRDLASDGPRTALAAMGKLAAAPKAALDLIRERLIKAPAKVDVQRVRRLIADLDDKRFATREAASRELGELGRAAEGELRAALAGRPSDEARRRMEQLLGRIQPAAASGVQLQALRAVALLEQLGTSEARELLRQARDGDAALAGQAGAALKRLARGR